MNPTIVVALIAFVGSVVSALATWRSRKNVVQVRQDLAALNAKAQLELQAEERRMKQEDILAHFRGPLIHATYDLQSRIYNILINRFAQVDYDLANDRHPSYVVNNTLFVIAQYFCWMEIIRLEVQFLDLGVEEETKQLGELRDNIYSLWQSQDPDQAFMVWAGEQRAIGECMISSGRQERECMGYSTFIEALESDKIHILRDLEEDVKALAENPDHGRERLTKLQHALIDLLDFLDPDCVHFPKEHRTKI